MGKQKSPSKVGSTLTACMSGCCQRGGVTYSALEVQGVVLAQDALEAAHERAPAHIPLHRHLPCKRQQHLRLSRQIYAVAQQPHVNID